MQSDQGTSSPSAPLSWQAMQRVWPHASTSRFVDAGGVRWHVQMVGEGPTLLLLHGAGASTHSWRDLYGPLAETFRVIAIDLPGHAFTDSPIVYRPSLPRVSSLIANLLQVLGVNVDVACGHSAGAAILTRMTLDRVINPRAIISFNGAFQPFDGAAGAVFPTLARLLFLNPLTPRLAAIGGRKRERIVRLIESTGSHLPDDAVSLYQVLMQSPGHISGVLSMMANWDLTTMVQSLHALDTPLLLVAADNDLAVPPTVALDVQRVCPRSELEVWSGLGHLAHEEVPDRAVATIRDFARKHDVIASASVQAGMR